MGANINTGEHFRELIVTKLQEKRCRLKDFGVFTIDEQLSLQFRLREMTQEGLIGFNSGTDRFYLRQSETAVTIKQQEDKHMSTQRTAANLRDRLFDALDLVINGDINPEQAKAAAIVAREITDNAKVELEFMSATKHERIQGSMGSMPIGLEHRSN